MAQQGQALGAGMSNGEFRGLGVKAFEGKTAEVLAAVDQDRRLATRAGGVGTTLLIWACMGSHDNLQLAQGLLERGANMHARNSAGWDALMYASQNGYLAVCTVLVDRKADPDSRTQYDSALQMAARYDHLQVCLLLISRRANLMMVVNGRTALDVYGGNTRLRTALDRCGEYTCLKPSEIEQRRAMLWNAFAQGPHPDARWARRWPLIKVMVQCDFQPTAARKAQLLLLNPPLPPNVSIPPIVIATAAQKRAYLAGLVFSHPGIWRMVASYL